MNKQKSPNERKSPEERARIAVNDVTITFAFCARRDALNAHANGELQAERESVEKFRIWRSINKSLQKDVQAEDRSA